MTKAVRIGNTVQCDVLIIGAGGAGFRCAATILDKAPETRIIALTKGAHSQKSHTSTAQGGLAAVDPQDPADKTVYHMFDTWKGSDCMADQDVIKKVCEAAWEEIVWLESRGMHFSRDHEGKLAKRTFGGHTLNFGESSAFRAVFEDDRTGKGIMDTCWGETLKRGITFINQGMAIELLFKDSRCVGCIVFKQKTGEIINIQSKATVLATGGSGQVFKITTNCRQNTGDGLALVLRAGLAVMDPEAVQFHPTGIVGPGILASETLRSVGGILRNRDGEPFMERYAPQMRELAPRDLVSRAIATEIREGRGILNPDHQVEHVWIDLRHLPEAVHTQQIPEVTGFFRKYLNLDPQKELCPVHPSNHYHMGGIPTNAVGEVLDNQLQVVHALYAVGECAAASFHGFNRLGTNSILELVATGRFVGEAILTHLKDAPQQSPQVQKSIHLSLFDRYLEARGSENTDQLREAMRTVMTAHLGIFRTETGILKAIEALKELKERAAKISVFNKSLRMNQEMIQRWELDSLLSVAMVIARAALERKESRGGHYRDDFPVRNDAYHYHTLVSMPQFGEIELGRRKVDMSLYEARDAVSQQFGIIERRY